MNPARAMRLLNSGGYVFGSQADQVYCIRLVYTSYHYRFVRHSRRQDNSAGPVKDMFFLVFAYVYFYFRPQVINVCRIKSDKYQNFVSIWTYFSPINPNVLIESAGFTAIGMSRRIKSCNFMNAVSLS